MGLTSPSAVHTHQSRCNPIPKCQLSPSHPEKRSLSPASLPPPPTPSHPTPTRAGAELGTAKRRGHKRPAWPPPQPQRADAPQRRTQGGDSAGSGDARPRRPLADPSPAHAAPTQAAQRLDPRRPGRKTESASLAPPSPEPAPPNRHPPARAAPLPAALPRRPRTARPQPRTHRLPEQEVQTKEPTVMFT